MPQINEMPTATPAASDLIPVQPVGGATKAATVASLPSGFPDASLTIAKTSGLQTAIDGRQRSHVVDVRDHGADSTGVASSTAAFESARAAAGVNGTVRVPSGTYRIKNFLWSVAGQRWVFEAGSVVKLYGTTTSSDWFGRIYASGVTLEGPGTFDGTVTGAINTNDFVVGNVITSGVTLQGLTIKNFSYGFNAYQSSDLRILNNVVQNCRYGFNVNNNGTSGAANNIIVSDNLIDNSSVANGGGIKIWSDTLTDRNQNVVISGNVIRLATNSASGMCIESASLKNFAVIGNVTEGGYMGISLPIATNGTVGGNTMRGFYNTGLELPVGAANVTVVGNVIDGAAVTQPATATSISLGAGGGSSILIANNIVRGMTGTRWFYVDTAVVDVSIVGNQFYNDQNVNSLIGLYWNTANVGDVVISDNTFDGGTGTLGRAATFGAGPPTSLVVSGNTFKNFATGCVALYGSSGTFDNIRSGNNLVVNCGSPPIMNNMSGTAVLGANTKYERSGSLGPPSVPASTVPYTNLYACDASVYVTGGTVTAIAVGGVTTGLTSGHVRVPAGSTITLTYTVAPTWVWVAT